MGPRTFEQDKSWLRVGIAIRTGIDINLHRVALSKSARQGLPNWLLRMIIRTWLLTYVIDRTLSAQLGKPTTLRGEHSFQLYSDLISQEEGQKTIDDAWVSSLAVRTDEPIMIVADHRGMDSNAGKSSRCVRIRLVRLSSFSISVFPIPRLGPCVPKTVSSTIRILHGEC